MTALGLDEIERAAREATPGLWLHSATATFVEHPDGEREVARTSVAYARYRLSERECCANARHIATSCPSTVLAMVARIREQDATIAKLIKAQSQKDK